MITIRNPSLQPLSVIEHYMNDEIKEEINSNYTFTFGTIIDEDGKSEYLVDGNIADVDGRLFNIVHHRRTRGADGILVAVECEHVSYDLIRTTWADGFVNAGTPEQLLGMALDGTGFTIGTVELADYISVDLAEENISARAIVLEIAAQAGGELRFDGYTVSLLQRRGITRGVMFSVGKNLVGIVKDVDVRSGERVTSYEMDILELNSLPEFAGLEYFELGDTVMIYDPELGISEQQRIVSYSYSPRRRINSKVSISNKITGIADTVVSLRKTTIVKDKSYYGNRFGPEYGFQSERYDKLARSVFNADEFRMQKGNGTGSYTDAIFFDPSEGEYEFTGIVRAASFIGGTIVIGSGDNAFRASDWGIWLGDEVFADAPFSVNVAGKMKAVDGDFQGKITSSEIAGGVITGAQIRTGESGVYPYAEMSNTNKTFTVAASPSSRVEMTSSGGPGATVGVNIVGGGSTSSLSYGNSGVYLFGNSNITMEAMNIFLRGYNGAYVSRWSDFRSEETGVSLETELSALAINMTFDPSTRNLKLWSKGGYLLSQVNIPAE